MAGLKGGVWTPGRSRRLPEWALAAEGAHATGQTESVFPGGGEASAKGERMGGQKKWGGAGEGGPLMRLSVVSEGHR